MKFDLKHRWQHLKLFDKNPVIYWLLLSVLLIFFHRNSSYWYLLVLLNFVYIAAVLTFIPMLDRQKSAIAHFVRYGYIIAILPLLYLQVKPFLHTIHFQEFDPVILRFESAVFGEVSNIWVQKFVKPPLTEFMQVSYSLYWITIPLAGLIFYFRKEYLLYENLMHYVTITFFLSYFVFIFFPVAGPRFFIADQITAQYRGLFFAHYLREFMTHAGFRGGAFPSSHVGVAVVILLFMWRFKPKVAVAVFLPIVIALSLATVYGQYHYFTDVIAGLVMGISIGLYGSFLTAKRVKNNQSIYNRHNE
ncbi:MAG TPA: phosphatase PAP2 family protein [Caldithrix sp.]|nr:phosphatase PAP2 family protein [Caldithrix sp.]